MALEFKEKSEDVAPFQRRLLFAFAAIMWFLLFIGGRFPWVKIFNMNDYFERA